MNASSMGHTDIMTQLIAAGADVNAKGAKASQLETILAE